MINEGNGSYKDTVLNILKKHNADMKAINRWEKKCKTKMTETFARFMDEVKQFDALPSPITKGNSKQSPKKSPTKQI